MLKTIPGFAAYFFEKELLYNREKREGTEMGIYFLSHDGSTLCAAAEGEMPLGEQNLRTDLRAVSSFVNEKLVAHQGGLQELPLLGYEKIWQNLTHLDTLIGRHNKKIEENLWVIVTTVLLLVLSLGLYDYTRHLLADRLELHLFSVLPL